MPKILKAKKICFDNDRGGTEIMSGLFEFVIKKSWYDYECGGRIIGELTNKEQIKKIQKIRKTGFPPKKKYNPKEVYVSEFDLV